MKTIYKWFLRVWLKCLMDDKKYIKYCLKVTKDKEDIVYLENELVCINNQLHKIEQRYLNVNRK